MFREIWNCLKNHNQLSFKKTLGERTRHDYGRSQESRGLYQTQTTTSFNRTQERSD